VVERGAQRKAQRRGVNVEMVDSTAERCIGFRWTVLKKRHRAERGFDQTTRNQEGFVQ